MRLENDEINAINESYNQINVKIDKTNVRRRLKMIFFLLIVVDSENDETSVTRVFQCGLGKIYPLNKIKNIVSL